MSSRLTPIAMAVLIALPGAGFSQDAGVTTVAPLTVTPQRRDPDLITPQEIAKTIETSRDDGLGALWQLCLPRGVLKPRTEAEGAFGGQALQYTLLQAGVEVSKAAQALQAANQRHASLAAAGATPEALTQAQAERQSAARRYEGARRIYAEANQRVNDFQAQWDVQVTWGAVEASASRVSDMNYFHRLMALYHVNTVREVMDLLTRQRMENRVVEGVYVPLEYSDLLISRVQAKKVTVHGRPAMQINGLIHNTRDQAIAIPPLWFTAVDAHEQPLRSEQAVAQAAGKRIEPAKFITFNFILQPSPEATDHVVVTFAPTERRRIPGIEIGSCVVSQPLRDAFEKGDIPPPDAPWITGVPAPAGRALAPADEFAELADNGRAMFNGPNSTVPTGLQILETVNGRLTVASTLKVGDLYGDGWTIVAFDGVSVTLRKDAVTHTVKLKTRPGGATMNATINGVRISGPGLGF
jgi:hypothetical protein